MKNSINIFPEINTDEEYENFKLDNEAKKLIDNEMENKLLSPEEKVYRAHSLFNVNPVFDHMSLDEILAFDIKKEIELNSLINLLPIQSSDDSLH